MTSYSQDYHRRYYRQNKERLQRLKRQYYQQNKEQLLNKQKRYYRQNKEHYKERYNNDFSYNVIKKIRALIYADKKHNRFLEGEDYIDEEWTYFMICQQNCKCYYCDVNIKMINYNKYDPHQLSFDRLNNSLPHLKKNTVLTCLHCNLQNRTKKLQNDDFRFLKQFCLIEI